MSGKYFSSVQPQVIYSGTLTRTPGEESSWNFKNMLHRLWGRS